MLRGQADFLMVGSLGVQPTARQALAVDPALVLAGVRDGYWQGKDAEAGVVRQVRDSRADLLFVAISSPKKEQFLGLYQAEMRIPFAMGVGGSFDVAIGRVKRAPAWMQMAGLEWFFRFLQEPRRMFRRYFIDDMAFLWLLIKEAARTND